MDEGAAATPHGQLVFFAEFLATTGVFERFAACCPLACRSGNAPDKRDVLGTLMLGGAAPHVGSMPMDAGSPEFDTNCCKSLIHIGQALEIATTAAASRCRGWAS
ncbi:MAG: hypothetical protein O9343_11395 [Burkholderiaceae bacterium]|nr:hypothetical protein [Burkholderiaceae bacterium]